MEVYVKGYTAPVTLTEVERDDEKAVVGTTDSGKRFVCSRANIMTAPEPMPARHPYRIYLNGGMVLRAVEPEFEAMEKFYLAEENVQPYEGSETVEARLEDGRYVTLKRDDIRSVLSAMPEDERAAIAAAN